MARNQIEVISPEISQLTNLVELDLWSNQIDIIPYQIGYIKTLTRLELGRNHLGTVPSEIGQLTNLIELHLAFNQIRSLPNELFELINLEVLSLEFNLIRFLPNRVNQLSRLRILNLGRNRLAQFPVGISQLFNLRQLNLSDNQIKFLPSSINDLTKLEHFWFSRNYLKQIPIELWELSRLTELHLDNNRIHQIPSELKNLKNLISLNLSHNRLTEIPPQILDLQKLETLNLEGNIRHSIETDFGELLTYRERMELALQQAEIAKKEADHANQVKGQFLSQMSHELRTPMNGVIGFLNLISKETLTPKQKEYLRRATNSGQHLLNVIDEILQFSELEKGQVKDQKVVFDLVDTCHQVMEMVTPLSRQKNLDLHFDHLQVMSTEWVGDQQKIKQVLVNLLGNAIKFTNQGKISLKLLQISNGIRIEVSDTGIGIATEHIEDIFEPFTQASNGKTRNFPGTGLGLTISQQLIQKMGGQIEVESQLKKGSTFWLELPLQKIEVKPQTKAKDIILDDFTGRKALVVDDELISREVARVYLQRCGFLVDEAFGGSDCLKQLKANKYDLIIMDLQMPELDGFKVVEQIRKLERKLGQKEVAILGLSADVTGEVQDRYKLEEVGDYLGKPFKMGELKHKIRKLLNS